MTVPPLSQGWQCQTFLSRSTLQLGVAVVVERAAARSPGAVAEEFYPVVVKVLIQRKLG